MHATEHQPIGLRFNRWFEKYMFLIIPVSLLAGFLFSEELIQWTSAVPILFAFVTLVMALGCNVSDIRQALRNPWIIIATLFITHLLGPCVAYLLGAFSYGSNSPYVIGFVLFTAIPLGISSILWVGMSSGRVPLILSLVVIDSALSPLIVPWTLTLLFGTHVEFHTWEIMLDLLIIVVLPTIVGVSLRHKFGERLKRATDPVTLPLSKLCFVGVVGLNAAAIAPDLQGQWSTAWTIIPTTILLVALCYLLGYVTVWVLKGNQLASTLSYAIGMRNISLGIVIGVAYFEPLAALPVVFATLVQQPMATVNHWLLRKLEHLKARRGEI